MVRRSIAITFRPLRSIREITSPIRLRRTASGFTKIRVRSGTTAPCHFLNCGFLRRHVLARAAACVAGCGRAVCRAGELGRAYPLTRRPFAPPRPPRATCPRAFVLAVGRGGAGGARRGAPGGGGAWGVGGRGRRARAAAPAAATPRSPPRRGAPLCSPGDQN